MTKVKIEFDYHEAYDHMMVTLRAADLNAALSDAREMIRSRLKHFGGPFGPTEVEFLDSLRGSLFVDGIQ